MFEAQQHGTYFEVQSRLAGIATRWLKHAPAEAFQSFLNLPNPEHRQSVLRVIIRGWAETDSAAALAAAESVEDLTLRQQLIVAALHETDPAEAVERLEAVPGQLDQKAYALAFSQWAKQDIEAATRRLASLGQPLLRREVTKAIVQALASGETPGAALDWAQSLEDERERTEAFFQAVEAVSSRHPEAAAAALLEMEDSPKKWEAINSLMGTWASRSRGSSQAALDWARDHITGLTRDQALNTIARELVYTDPENAVTVLEEILDQGMREDLARELAENWGETDPRSAFAWAEGLEADVRESALSELANEWASRDPWEAAAFAASLPADGPAIQRFRERLVESWARVDPEGAAQWAAALPGDSGRSAYRRALIGWAGTDPQQAAVHLDALEDSALREELADEFVGQWGHRHPSTAAEWASQRLDPSSHTFTFRNLARSWSQYDSMGASKWVGTLPEGAGRDAAIEALIGTIAPADPAGAAAWAETISDPALRESWRAKLGR